MLRGFDAAAVLGLLIALLAATTWPRSRLAWAATAIGLITAIAMDQQRLQPWAYQSLLYAMLFATRPWRSARPWVMAIAVSVYFYSSAGKIDFQFVHTVGKDMVQAFARPLGGLDDPLATRLAFLLPAGEMVIALLLTLPPTRRLGGGLAIAMHVALIGLLGPWMLGHSFGVLTWNTVLAGQAWILFVRRQGSGDLEPKHTSAWARWPVNAGVCLALIAPLTERRGYWDHWPSWALYSPHNSRIDFEVHRSALQRLPAAWQTYVRDDEDGDGWQRFDLESLSLDQRWVPVYPQARYQLQLGLRIADRYKLQDAIRATIKGVSDRWSGHRQQSFALGRDELWRQNREYWIGSP
ncbi:hypothetical protein FYK55_02110 [Roseiconus nitratireducens]|uniref:Methylamine utilisation protein MauE domain-containing protein n=1 Tax=Roseiconus nitratireducens TaxID=2605748 RepID=A0A5M6DI32_9BACT|nr:MauE/DoxX family redox-associated membrane protein [Roseiconus nitratireducens]KAA5547218.1 hypothetical protein FYK55_02110 [Roseiconus nitratireducens]